MANTKKLIQAAAGSAGGAGLNVEEVFSTYLYEGNRTARNIVNGIDLAGEGGMVWTAARNVADNKRVWDSERGVNKDISTNSTAAQSTRTDALTSFNSDGFSLGVDAAGVVNANSGETYASWTFRKAPKFFDVVTYTGDGTGTQNISHNLGSTPGCIIVKRTDTTEDWWVYHRGVNSANDQLKLNSTAAAGVGSFRFGVVGSTLDINSSTFTVGGGSFGALDLNQNNGTYVAYLFAHNDGDGDFGPTGDQDIIKCGSVSYNAGATVDLGFEPQWVLIKPSNNTGNWILNDVMRGMPSGSRGPRLDADGSGAEIANATVVYPTSTGFTMPAFLYDPTDLIYIAIRRGPMAVPESGTEVFAMDFRFSSEAQALNPKHQYFSGWPVDVHLNLRRSSGGVYAYSRLQGGSNFLRTPTTDAEVASTTNQFGSNEGLYPLGFTNTEDTTQLAHMFRRAPNYFDVVAYTGNGTAGRTVSHNLGVAPEMIWVKKRNGTSNWIAYHKDIGNNAIIYPNLTNASFTTTDYWNSTTPTESVFTLGGNGNVNGTSDTFIAYLFASLDGVSKVGSYTGNGTSQTIDCGFTTGARFILIKRTDTNGDWWVLDTKRGIVAGNDALLNLNTTSAEVTSVDVIDPNSSGFTVDTTNGDFNASGGSYIFYAIA